MDFIFEPRFTSAYVSFQVIVLLVVLGILWKNKGWYAHTNTAASILTIVGVLGTFIGIFIGLLDFNPESDNLPGSIGALLNGLKFAFGTSIVGIASALLLKGIISPLSQINGNRDRDPEQETINKFVDVLTEALRSVETPRELIAAIKENGETTQKVLRDMRNDLINEQRGNLKQLETLTDTVSDEHNQLRVDRKTTRDVLQGTKDDLINGQGKILEQLETLTNTVSDKHDLIIASQKDEATKTRKTLADMQSELTDRQGRAFRQLRTLTKTVSYEHNQLRKEFETFSKNVAESITELATKELIFSLTKVIENFNTQLSTQFGDNFKQLNEAVGRTVAWQEQYRQQMEELADEFRVAAESIEKSGESVALIAESSNTISSRSESIVACTEKLNPILHTLNDQLDAFSELRQRALEAFPLIENRLNELTVDFSSAVQTVITESHESVETQRTALAEQAGHLQTTVENTTQDFNKLTTSFSGSVETSIAQAHNSMNQQREALITQFSELENAIGTANQHFQETIDEIGSQLDSVFKKSADHITQLTTGFTQGLTQRLEGTLNEVTNGFTDVVGTAIADSQESMEKQRTALNTHSSTLQTTINDVSQQIDGLMKDVSNTVNGSQSSMDQQRQELLRLTQQLQANFKALETTLEVGLTESLESLAGKLAALSEKFVEDYTPLTEELYRLVSMARSNQVDARSNQVDPDIPF